MSKGEWIEKTDKDYCGGGYWECSECGMRYSFGAYHEVDEFNFCPKCGHPMITSNYRREEQDAQEEARREAMRLDDNEDTAKWRGYA